MGAFFHYTFWIAATSWYVLLWPDLLLPGAERLLKSAVFRVKTQQPLVALSFDDGPDPKHTPEVLQILAAHNVKATFFLAGEQVRRYPEIAGRIRAAGHDIGNHSNTWRRTISLNPQEFEADLVAAERTIQPTEPKFFRPAGGMIKPSQMRVLQRHGYRCILASILPFDPHRPPASWIRILATRSLRPGAILVLHDAGGDRTRTVQALPQILAEASKRNLQFVPVSELLDAAAKRGHP